MYTGERKFRSAPWMKCFGIGIAAVAMPLALLEYSSNRLTWVSVVFFVLSIASIIGTGAVFTDGIDLEPHKLVIRKNFRRTEIEQSVIDEAKWEKGSGVSLRLSDGRWVKMPEVGRNSQSLCNSLRAWIKAT